MVTRTTWTIVGLLVAVGGPACSSSASGEDAPAPNDPSPALARAGEIRKNDTWTDGVTLTGTVSIAAGAVVDIAPGATVKCAEGATILVGGELRVRATASKPAKITCGSWQGILLAKGGKIDAEGLTIENAATAIAMTEGAADSRFVSGSILQSVNPFMVAKASSLVVDQSKIVVPAKTNPNTVSQPEIRGSLKATKIDYDASNNEGISVKDGGELVIEDSIIHGQNGFDMVSAYDGKRLEVRYSILKGGHCGLHIQGLDTFLVDHVSSEENTYGITLYKSGAGPNTISSSNVTGLAAWLDFQGDHGPITMENIYVTGNEIMKGGPAPTITKASAPIADAKPR